jgi:hypothetical protein
LTGTGYAARRGVPEHDAQMTERAQESASHFIVQFGLAGHPGRPLPELPFQASERLLF